MNYIQYMKPGGNFNSSQWDFNKVDKSKLTPEQINYAVEQYFWRTKDPEMKKQYELWSNYQQNVNASQNADPISNTAAASELPEVTITMAKPNYIDQIKADIRNKWANMSTEDKIHAGIDAATTVGGFIPGVDVVTDGIDILHSLQRKDWAGAGIGTAAMVLPFVSAPILRHIVDPQSIGDILKNFKIGGRQVGIQHRPVIVNQSLNIEEELGRLGVPKGERRQWLKGHTADRAYDSALGLGNNTYTKAVRDAHFKAKSGKGTLNVTHASLADFTTFEPRKGWADQIDPFYHFGTEETANWFLRSDPTYRVKRYHLNLNNPLEVKDNTHGNLFEIISELKRNKMIDDKKAIELKDKYWRLAEDDVHEAVAQLLQELNFDGIRYINEIEAPGSLAWGVPRRTQIKSADAITYDDKGNIIPLSLRDNFQIADTRYKSGGSIKIKKKNIGSFTRYCNGKVTEECIRKGKNSSNPTTRKRANFAANARKWKHEEGGKINYLNYFK